MALSMEKTRSAAAELGVKAKTIRAASAHAGNLLPWTFHQWSTPSVKAWLSLDSELFVKTVVLGAHRVPSRPGRPSDDKLRPPTKKKLRVPMRARSAGARSLAAVDVGSAGAGGGGAKTVHPSTLARFFGLNKSGADEHREHGAKLAALHRLLRARGAAAARACAHHPGTQTCVAPALRAAPR